jgi:hypothetical protein
VDTLSFQLFEMSQAIIAHGSPVSGMCRPNLAWIRGAEL